MSAKRGLGATGSTQDPCPLTSPEPLVAMSEADAGDIAPTPCAEPEEAGDASSATG